VTKLSVWAVYARVSTEEQAKFGASLASQVEAARNRAVELGASEVVEFVDEGVPGDVLGRPGITRLREAIANRAIAGLVVYDPDRLARNLSHQLLITEEIQTAGVKLEFINFEWKDTDEGRLFYSIRGAISEYEKAKIRERTGRGKWTKVKQGFSPNGRVPYGYLFDKPTRTIAVNGETAPWIHKIFSWITEEGLGPHRLAARLNGLNVPPPARAEKWGTSSLRHIISNPAYTGLQVVHKYNTEGTHKNPHVPKEQRKSAKERPPEEWMTIPVPKLVDERTWELAQEAMLDLRRKYAGREAKHFFLLSRVAACGVCGLSLYGMQLNRKINNRYYRCTSQVSERAPKCALPFMPADKLDEAVWAKVVEWATTPESHFKAVQDASQAAKPRATGADVKHLEKQLEEVKREQTQLQSLVAKGLVKLEHVSGAIRDLSERAKSLAVVIDQIAQENAMLPHWTPEQVTPLTKEEMDNYPPEQKQAAVRRYVERVHVHPDGKLRVVPRINPAVVI
jgi:site-specific DNA recombinase